MAVCVATVGGALQVTGTAIGSCTDYVLYTASEFAALSPQLSLDDQMLLWGSVVGVWAIAYGIKVLRRSL